MSIQNGSYSGVHRNYLGGPVRVAPTRTQIVSFNAPTEKDGDVDHQHGRLLDVGWGGGLDSRRYSTTKNTREAHTEHYEVWGTRILTKGTFNPVLIL
jgi:hypothetical protein